jgi:hypothetical protein
MGKCGEKIIFKDLSCLGVRVGERRKFGGLTSQMRFTGRLHTGYGTRSSRIDDQVLGSLLRIRLGGHKARKHPESRNISNPTLLTVHENHT